MKLRYDLKKFLCLVLVACCVIVFGTVTASGLSYQDGTYQVSVSLSGGKMGHNDVLSPCTVTVSGGVPYATLVFKRVTAPWHAPSYEWLRTSRGTVYPVVNEGNYTNTFNQVPLPGLGSVSITTLSTAMSEPHEISYTLYFDPGAIPVVDSSGQSSQDNQTVNQKKDKTEKESTNKDKDKEKDKEKSKDKKDNKEKNEKNNSSKKKDKNSDVDKKSKTSNNKTKGEKDSKNLADTKNDVQESKTKSIVYAAVAIAALLIAGGCVFVLIKGAKK